MKRLGRFGVAVLGALVLSGVVAVPAAAPAPIAFSPTPIAGWSTNGPVLAVRIVGDTVYVGGDFTEVRGPGGSPTVARARLAAFDVHTGALREGFSADTDARVESLASDGTRLFVGGDFMTIKGVSRVRLASLDLTTGNVNNGFFTGASSHVYALAVRGDRLYVGGSFGILGSTPRNRIGVLNTTTSAVDPRFNPGADNTVNGLALSPDGNTVYAGGIFTTIGGGTRANIAPLSATTGALQPLTFDYPRFIGSIPQLMDLDISPSGDRLFAALGGNENQALSWSTATGARQWSHQVDGDAQAVRYSNGNLYFGFHEGDLGDPTVRLLVADAATGEIAPTYRLPINSFFGVWDIDASPDALVIGGEFTNVNGVATQGVAILPRGTADTTAPTAPGNLHVTGTTNTSISLAWDAGTDNVAVAGYRVLRNGVEIAYPTGTTFTDTGLTTAADFSYAVQTVDAAGNFSSSAGPIPVGTDATFVTANSVWKYTDDGVERGTAWKELTYDDTTWKSGAGQLGYGDGDETTTMFNGGSVPANRYISHYLRETFTVSNAALVSGLTLGVLRDDGVVVYVNGVEAVRDNMPTGPITAQTLALNAQFDAAETTYFDFAIPPGLLREGTNVLAVSVHNESRQGTGDLSFDARLTARRQGPTAPGAPTNLRSTATTATTASLAWDAPAGTITGYRVYRNGTPVGTPSGTTFADTGLTASTTYSYTVTAINNLALESAPTAPLSVTTTQLVTTETLIGTSSVWKYTDDGIERGTTWKDLTYDDAAWKSGAGQLGYGDGDENTVMNNGGTVVANRFISHYLRRSFTVANAAQISGLALSVVRDDGVVVYVNGVEAVRDNMPTGTITSTTFATAAQFDAAETTYFPFAIPPALLHDGTNVIAVSVHNESRQGAGDLSFDARLTATRQGAPAPDTTAPTTPTNLAAPTIGATSVVLTWSASTDNVGVTGYDLLRDGSLIAGPTATTVTDISVVPNHAYSYTVRAHDAAGNVSPLSTPLVVTTPAGATDTTPPSVPANLRATSRGATQVALAWDASTDNTAVTGYVVTRNGVALPAVTPTTFTDGLLAPGAAYTYTVRALDAALNPSAPSAALAVTTHLASETTFAAGSIWKYTDDGIERGTAWKELVYDDTTWKSGAGQLGYGDGDETTTMFNGGTVVDQRYLSHYLRRSFTIADASRVNGATLSVLRDDGVIVYVNGVEAFRDNMPTGVITSSTFALNAQFDAAEATYFDFAIPPALLREGNNVIAVSVHNESRQGAGDLSFDARLTTRYA